MMMPGMPVAGAQGQMPNMPMFPPQMMQMPQGQTPGAEVPTTPEQMTQYNQQVIMMQQQALAQYHQAFMQMYMMQAQ